jgi:hypothetical protein
MSDQDTNPAGARSVDADPTKVEERRRSEVQERRYYKWLSEEARRRIDKKPSMKDPSERRQVANNLHRILETLKARRPPIRKREVLHAGGPRPRWLHEEA